MRVFTDATGGGGEDGIGAVRERCTSSNASPVRNFTGEVSGVVLNNLRPRSQIPVLGTGRYFRAMNVGDSTEAYLLRGPSQWKTTPVTHRG